METPKDKKILKATRDEQIDGKGMTISQAADCQIAIMLTWKQWNNNLHQAKNKSVNLENNFEDIFQKQGKTDILRQIKDESLIQGTITKWNSKGYTSDEGKRSKHKKEQRAQIW